MRLKVVNKNEACGYSPPLWCILEMCHVLWPSLFVFGILSRHCQWDRGKLELQNCYWLWSGFKWTNNALFLFCLQRVERWSGTASFHLQSSMRKRSCHYCAFSLLGKLIIAALSWLWTHTLKLILTVSIKACWFMLLSVLFYFFQLSTRGWVASSSSPWLPVWCWSTKAALVTAHLCHLHHRPHLPAICSQLLVHLWKSKTHRKDPRGRRCRVTLLS